MFKPINEGLIILIPDNKSPYWCFSIDADELIPQEGKDEMYNKVVSEIDGLEQSLELDLKKLLGMVTVYAWFTCRSNMFGKG